MQDVLAGAHGRGPARFSEIVPIVLREAAKLRGAGHLTATVFEKKLARLSAEELTPRGLELLVRHLANGTTRFLIKDSETGCTCHMIDCAPKPAAEAAAADLPQPAERCEPVLRGCMAAA